MYILGVGSLVCRLVGGYLLFALVSVSLGLGGLLNPIMGLSGKILLQSELLEMMFQFLWIISLMLGFDGL